MEALKWRGRPWKYWHKVSPKIPVLRKQIELYLGHMTPLFKDLETRNDLLLLLMQVIDDFQPPLTDPDAYAAIQHQRRPPHSPTTKVINLSPTSPLPYRGRGPVWLDNSSLVDCCIVAARLMNLGYLDADLRGESRLNWLQSLSDMQRAFLSAVELPWEAFADETNTRIRHNFLQIHHATSQELVKEGKFGDILSAIDSWQVCTGGFGQFEYLAYEQVACDGCQRVFPHSPPEHPSKRSTLDLGRASGHELKSFGQTSIADGFRRQFAPRMSRCHRFGCHGHAWERLVVLGDLPYRLVVPTSTSPARQRGERTRMDGSIPGLITDKTRIQFRNEHGEQVADYRWTGGVYELNQHFRLYWLDPKLDENAKLVVYDGMRFSGSITEGSSPFRIADLIPPAWGSEVLFYERFYPEGPHAKFDSARASIEKPPACDESFYGAWHGRREQILKSKTEVGVLKSQRPKLRLITS